MLAKQKNMHTFAKQVDGTPPNTKEDLGLTPLEARSVGVPCIASIDGGVVETAGRHALFCKPGDVESLKESLCKAICMDNVQYNKMTKLAKEGIENMSVHFVNIRNNILNY